jgi:hypothetical protein
MRSIAWSFGENIPSAFRQPKAVSWVFLFSYIFLFSPISGIAQDFPILKHLLRRLLSPSKCSVQAEVLYLDLFISVRVCAVPSA